MICLFREGLEGTARRFRDRFARRPAGAGSGRERPGAEPGRPHRPPPRAAAAGRDSRLL